MASPVLALTALHELIRRLLTVAMGYTDTNFFRPDGQRAPAGAFKDPYATVKLYNNSLASYNLRRFSVTDPVVVGLVPVGTTDLIEVIDSCDVIVASVQFWRDGATDGSGRTAWGVGALDRASTLAKRMELSATVEQANKFGLGYGGSSIVRDLSAVVDGSQENRAQVDLTFYFSSPELAAINMFKVAQFDLKVQQPDGHIQEVRA